MKANRHAAGRISPGALADDSLSASLSFHRSDPANVAFADPSSQCRPHDRPLTAGAHEKGFRLSVVKVENLGVGTGFEPVTSRLNVWCSTFELSELGRHVEPVHGTTAANLLKA